MPKNLFDFGSEDVKSFVDSCTDFNEKTNEEKLEDVKTMYDKYKNFSQEELLNEFLTTSKQRLNNGSLTMEELNKTVQSLSPFLNSTQNEYLKGLLNKLND